MPAVIPAAEGKALREWIGGEGANREIHLDTESGRSSCGEGLLANGDPAARHLAVDPHQSSRFADGGLQFLGEARDGFFLDLVRLGRLVRQGGVVFLDDFQLPAIAQAASFCVTNLGWALEETSASDGDHHWAVLRTSVGPDTRPFDHHVDF